ncbi:hypothetical protein [Ruminiclostridium josui]|uniref:hypothetical protein n=1 Tax=Ruminiclostridium josui TaxID=1499 RepID=UPI001FA7B890|nr:hypothetical protein [Ruminiclostridium josui]
MSKRLVLVTILALVFTMAFSCMVFAVDMNAGSQTKNAGDSAVLPVYWYHQVFSDKPLYLQDGNTGKWYDNVKGTVEIRWSNYFSTAKTLITDLQVPDGTYQFTLATLASCSPDSIEGAFNIAKNGKIVASNIKGKLYGLSLPEGNYFKFYSDDTKWHFSAYITKRIDGTIK